MKESKLSRLITPLLCALGSAVDASGQQQLWSSEGARFGGRFGQAVALCHDVDGDGVFDLLAGEPGSACFDPSTFTGASMYRLSGATGGEIDSICDASFNTAFGDAVVQLGDVDGDLVPDFAVGAYLYGEPVPGAEAGGVFVYSGSTLSLIYHLVGEMSFAHFGQALASIDDVDGDGIGDLLVGSPAYDSFSVFGAAYVYSSASGSLLRSYYGTKPSEGVGVNVDSVGDINGDGLRDYAVAAGLGAGGKLRGRVVVYSTSDGAELHRWEGPDNSSLGNASTSIADLGDYDQDGFEDVLVGSSYVNGAGIVYAYSGLGGSKLFEVTGDRSDDAFGVAIQMLGDLNGDQVSEFLVGAPADDHDGAGAGAAFLFSGATRRPLYRFYPGYASASLGWRVWGGEEVTGDQIPDGVVAVRNGPKKKGSYGPEYLIAFAGNDLFLQATDTEIAEGDSVTLDTRGGEPGALTLLVLVDISGTPLFLPLALSTLDGYGEAALTGIAPTGTSGFDFTFLSFAQRHAGGRGLIDSSTETITIE